MSLSPEVVNQSVFVASLFLTFISVPKLVALSVWCVYKELVFLNLSKAVRSKAIQAFKEEGSADPLRKGEEDLKARMSLMIETLVGFQKDIRDPLIEASTAAIILYLLIPLIPSISSWIVTTLIMIVAVVLGTFVVTIVLWRRGNKMLKIETEKLTEDLRKALRDSTSQGNLND